MDFTKMLQQAQEMQKKMSEAKDSLKNLNAEGISGGGVVRVVLNGNHEMVSIHIDTETMKEDKIILEDLIVAATNNAKKGVEIKVQEEMSKLTGGMQLPPGFKFPF
tara:strand:+ start:570 stop:887 length:318 start_codon:yes stop_codon:yes gene_type:complete